MPQMEKGSKILYSIKIILNREPIEFLIKEYKTKSKNTFYSIESIINGQIIEYFQNSGLNVELKNIKEFVCLRLIDVQDMLFNNISSHITFMSNSLSIELTIEYIGPFIHITLQHFKDHHVIQ